MRVFVNVGTYTGKITRTDWSTRFLHEINAEPVIPMCGIRV